ncbi:MAG: hypothetical protein ACR2FG_00245 [Marmoricola sp.]
MTAAVAPARTRSAPLSVWGVALLLPVGPAAIAELRLILPYYTASETPEIFAAVQADPGRQSAVLWLGYLGVLTLVPGLFAAARVCRDGAPRLTAWALALSVPGYLSLGVLLSTDYLLWSVWDAGLTGADADAVVSATHPTVNIAIGVFVFGHVIGTVLLGIAMLRSGRIPAWAAWAIAVSQPLHFIATVILGSPQVDFVAWSLTALGMAVVARQLLREPTSPREDAEPRRFSGMAR